ncbi:MAG TPA: sigma-70 family RNA polymerase sigma factor [Edaphobacter sp.]|nr:sigma-70 family RNA polymerase sigma factor [Edaphobacter sp.]
MRFVPADPVALALNPAPVAKTATAHAATNSTSGAALPPRRSHRRQDSMTATAFAGLLDQRRQFLHFVERRVGTRAIAEDIIQAAYIRAMEQAATLRSDESAVAWFYRILRNAVIDHYRHRAAEDRALEQWAQDLAIESQFDAPTQQIVCQCINNVLDKLKPAYSEIIREVDLTENTLESFAKKSGITPGNAAVRAHRARQALKKQLILTCRTCAKHGCIDCTCA